MTRKFSLPQLAMAAVLLGLIATLGVLQYQWVGQISAAEQERLRASLASGAREFALDFDRELTRAYLLFQVDVPSDARASAERFALRYDHWHATSRFPRVIAGFYLARQEDGGEFAVSRFNPATRQLEPSDWPASMTDWRAQIAEPSRVTTPEGPLTIRRIAPPVWESVPALVVPSPMMIVSTRGAGADLRVAPRFGYAILAIDREYVRRELLPSLAERHFRREGNVEYQVAVVERGTERGDRVFQSSPAFAPRADARADAAADLFQLRTQEFGAVASEIRRFTTFVAATRPAGGPQDATIHLETRHSQLTGPPGAQFSVLVPGGKPATAASVAGAVAGAARAAAAQSPRWRVLVKHPAGSLEAAVSKVRRRNLLISSSVLLLLAASLVTISVSSQRAQRLARQQMEFVAAVSHELRTPLAVIRSAGENLADGVIREDERVRRYGDLVRQEGRRLTEMVEQILEFSGIESGQRGFALQPVPVRPLLEGVVEASRALIDRVGLTVDVDVPESLPPVLGDESALRRVFQNLLTNAVKYGESGKWVGLQARASGREVIISVRDLGMGIAPAEHARIFEPFYRAPQAIAAQIQGAGLGLSLVKRIVDAHAGRVAVRSAPGEGSEFSVRLPAAGHHPATVAGTSHQAPAHAAGARS